MLVSKSCQYGVWAAMYLANKHNQGFISIREISTELVISFHFLSKILQKLTAQGYMESYKGPNGGLKLTSLGKNASVFDIIIAIDGLAKFSECALGLPNCGSNNPCPIHNHWAEIRDDITEMLRNSKLKDLNEQELFKRISFS